MATSYVRICLQWMLKLVNSVIGMVGIALIVYALWMLRTWQREMHNSAFFDLSAPWFLYASLGIGVSLCVITCSGHIAAETANGHCLSCYMVLVFLLFLLEAAVAADVFLNSHWEKDFPDDPTGKFDDLKHFLKSNFDVCKWIGVSIVAAQGISILLSMILRALGPGHEKCYDSDEDYEAPRLPLLNNQSQPSPYVVGEPQFTLKNNTWNARVQDKIPR